MALEPGNSRIFLRYSRSSVVSNAITTVNHVYDLSLILVVLVAECGFGDRRWRGFIVRRISGHHMQRRPVSVLRRVDPINCTCQESL